METIRLRTADGLESLFQGRLLASVSTDDGVKPYWLEMRLYQEAPGLGYVLYTVGRAAMPDKEDRPRVARASTARGVITLLEQERGGAVSLSRPARELLAQASTLDDAVADALTHRRID